eukprot:2852711-Pyramimonas_sp.AAC.1
MARTMIGASGFPASAWPLACPCGRVSRLARRVKALTCTSAPGEPSRAEGRVTKIFTKQGMTRVILEEAKVR